jgi:hypothetical protein
LASAKRVRATDGPIHSAGHDHVLVPAGAS